MSALIDPSASAASTLLSLPAVLDRAHQAVADVLAGLQSTRVALDGARVAAVGRLEHTHAKLKEVTSTTEGAASEILDALDRAQGLLDSLDADANAEAPDAAKARTTRDALREEMFGMMHALQFQDITTQQLSHTASMLTELEQRLTAIVALFDGTRVGLEGESMPAPMANERPYAPDATMDDAEARQLVADEVFVGSKRA